jgi:hypothetical protein
MSAIKFRSSFQNLFYQRDIGSQMRYRFTWMGRKAELGHVLEKQKKTTVVCRPLPNDTASSVGPTAPVLPELRADVRDQIPRHFRTVLSKKILALQMRVPIPWMGKAELGHVLEHKNDGGCIGRH